MLFPFPQPLVPGRLIKRYKRFLADIELADGQVVTAHCANSGRMTACLKEGAPVVLTDHGEGGKRKLRYTWQAIEMDESWVGTNTHNPNKVAKLAVERGLIDELKGYANLRTEVRYGAEGKSRIDLLLEEHPKLPRAYVEVKSVTLKEGEFGRFPDAPSTRGQKHLRELTAVCEQGERGVLLFLVGRSDVQTITPADGLDPAYGKLLREGLGKGLEVLAYGCEVCPEGISMGGRLPFSAD